MTQLHQQTLKSSISCVGIGLHTGRPVQLTLWPAAAGAGIRFSRSDLSPAVEIPALAENVVDTRLATTLGVDRARVSTVEHLLSALLGLGIDNVRIELDGPEVPIMDGSAAPFVSLIRAAGIEVQRKLRRFLVIRRPLEARDGDRLAQLLPAPELCVSCTIDFDHPLIQSQNLHLTVDARSFQREIAPARTFALRRDVEGLRKLGLAQGGSLENAVVVDDFNILNPEGLRFTDEFVRHKALDVLGDLALVGTPILGHVVAHKSGHALHQKLVRALRAAGDAVERVEAREERQLALKLDRLFGLATSPA